MPTRTRKQTVLITGCSTGIGAVTARVFSEKSWNVAATMRKVADGAALASLPSVTVFALDVTKEASVTAAVQATLEAFGSIDVLVNNAGYGTLGPFETASPDVIARQFDTNVHGVFTTTRAVLPAMRRQKAGGIVNVSSVGGLTTFPLMSLYHATKFALVGFSESLGFELAPFGIRVKLVAPGVVATSFANSLVRTFDGDGGPYAESIASVGAAWAKSEAATPSERVGRAIYDAAVDGSWRRRYVVGDDAVSLLDARVSMTDEQFVAVMLQRFGISRAGE